MKEGQIIFQLITLAENFLQLIKQENQLLKALKPYPIQLFQSLKKSYLSDYEKLLVILNGKDYKHSEEWKQLKTINKLLWNAIKENHALIVTLEKINRQILEDIYSEIITVKSCKKYEFKGKVKKNFSMPITCDQYA